MFVVLEDLLKMVNTARGKEKMFGYKSKLANQFYLWYFLAGGFYTDSTIHRRTKQFLVTLEMSTVIIVMGSAITYLIYGDKSDVQLMLFVTYEFFIMTFTNLVGPLIAGYFYGDEIMITIQMADDAIMKRSNCEKLDNEINVKNTVLLIAIMQLITVVISLTVPVLHTALFYEIEKITDYNYYSTYLPKLEEWITLTYYFSINITVGMAGSVFRIFFVATTITMVVFAGICHNELQYMVNDLNLLTAEDITTAEMYRGNIEPKFPTTLKKIIRDYRHLTRMIEKFQGFFKTMVGIMLFSFFFMELSHAINLIMPGTSPMIRIKELNSFTAAVIPVYACCWVGSVLEELAPTASFAVYSLPWYWSTTYRQDVYILLCQTQVPTDQKAIGVYPIQLRTFLRFLNIIQSTVNLIRTVAFTK